MSPAVDAFDFDLVTVGNAVIDHIHRVTVLPRVDEGVMILDRRSAPGGVEANVAAAAASLGLKVGIVARIGADDAGEILLDDFRRRGIDASRIHVGGAEDTAYTLAFVDGRGDRMMMTGGHGVRKLTLSAEDDAYIQRGRVCFASGYLVWPHLGRVADLCAAPEGPLFAFDLPGPFDDLTARGLQPWHVDAIAPAIDLFFANQECLRDFTGEEELEPGLAALRAKGIRRASVSDGARGLHLMERGAAGQEIHYIPSFPVAAVDTTGAGDVLHAALIAAWLLDEQPAPVAGRFAAAAAALSCLGYGCRAALPTREAAEALAAAHER
jgi:sugar/nucleoside kinase (ribokinase family)